MKKSEMFRKSIKDEKMQSRGLLIGLLCFLSALIIWLLLNYRTSFSNILLPFYIIAGIIIITILIIIVIVKYPDYYKLTDYEYKVIADELDNKIERGFPEYGIYITKNYLVHISNSISTHSFAVPFKDILDISNYGKGGYVYSKKKRRNLFLRILLSYIFDFDDISSSRGAKCNYCNKQKKISSGILLSSKW